MFRALGCPEFIETPNIIKTYPDTVQAIVLMLLRDTLTEGPQTAIAWLNCPLQAYDLLKSQYSFSNELTRASLYQEFHSLNFDKFEGSITDFNSKFNNTLAKLQLVGIQIDAVDLVNRYLYALERTFPNWAERTRSQLRTLRASGVLVRLPNAPPEAAGVAVGVVVDSVGAGVLVAVSADLAGGVAGGVETAGVGFSGVAKAVVDTGAADVDAGVDELLASNALVLPKGLVECVGVAPPNGVGAGAPNAGFDCSLLLD